MVTLTGELKSDYFRIEIGDIKTVSGLKNG